MSESFLPTSPSEVRCGFYNVRMLERNPIHVKHKAFGGQFSRFLHDSIWSDVSSETHQINTHVIHVGRKV